MEQPQGGNEQVYPAKGVTGTIIQEMFTQLIREKVRNGKDRNPCKKDYQRKGPGREGDTSVNMTSQN